MTSWLSDRGFDTGRLAFAGQTAVVASIAFVIAWLLGLEHPQWAAMTVWAASQPTRGQLLEKSFFRIAGTVIGTVAGVLLVMAMTIHPVLLVVGLALWVGACTFAGNLQRGFLVYGSVLAGYTAAMVALLDSAHPDHVLALGADRLATVLTGVLAAALVGYLFARPLPADVVRRKLSAVLVDLLDYVARPRQDTELSGDLVILSELTALEEGLERHAAGSLRSHRDIHDVRGVLIAAVPLLLWRREGHDTPGEIAAKLTIAADHLRRDDSAAAITALDAAVAHLPADDKLRENVERLRDALRRWLLSKHDAALAPQQTPNAPHVVLHRDWVLARDAMLRATSCLLLFGVIWLVTGWAAATFMLLGLSVMLSLFSTMDNPARLMRPVFVGQVLGVMGALACRWLVWPLATSEWQLIALTVPFILIGPLLVSHRRTTSASFDYNMVLLLLLQPHWPITGTIGASITAGLAVIAAPLAAMAAFNYVYPPTLRRRLDVLLAAMLHDLADLASDAAALRRRASWQARLYHRTLRLVRLSERSERVNVEALDAGLAFLNLGHAVMRCHELLASSTLSQSDRRALQHALARIGLLVGSPMLAQRALEALGRRFAGDDAMTFDRAATSVVLCSPQATTP